MKILEFKGKMQLKDKILIVSVILLIIAIITIVTLYILNENVRDWININILRKEVTEDDVATIEIDSDKSQSFFAYDKYVTILYNGKLEIYNNYASKTYEIEIGISNPIFNASGSNLLIAENGGQKICLISERKNTMGNKGRRKNKENKH